MDSAADYPGLRHQPSEHERRGPLFRAVRRVLRSQFGHPAGVVGRLVGRIMAAAPSNNDRIRWTLGLLDIKPSDRILEIGFGPGVAIGLASALAPRGFVAGVDHSSVMVRQAARRNAAGLRDGRIALCQATAGDLPPFGEPFDKIFAINSIHFWTEPIACLRRLRDRLRPGGVIALTLQPRSRGATETATALLGRELVQNLERAGFVDCRLETRRARPVSIVCALGTRGDAC
jgi:SAM-dependent methyltransferase